MAKGDRIYVNSRLPMEDLLTTLVHEGRHQLDIASKVIPRYNPGGRLSLLAEMRAWRDAGRFAAANDFTSVQAFRYGNPNYSLVHMAIEIEKNYLGQIGFVPDADMMSVIKQMETF